MPCDFGTVERLVKKFDRVHLPEDYEQIIASRKTTNLHLPVLPIIKF